MDYENSMRIGAQRYQQVTDALNVAGWPAKFTQTGGMNLAIEITLEGGHQVLITDVDDCLSWDPRDNAGWDVMFYPDPDRPELGDGPFAFASAEGRSVETLLDLVKCVVRSGTRRLALDGIQRAAEQPVAEESSQAMRSRAPGRATNQVRRRGR